MANPGSVIQRQIGTPDSHVAMPPDNGLGEIGAALMHGADVAHEYQVKRDNAVAEKALVGARLQYANGLDDLAQKYENDPDPATAPTRFRDEAQKMADPLYATLTDDATRNSFALDAGQLALSRRIGIEDLSHRRLTDQAVADLDSLGETASRQAAAATNSAERQAPIDSYAKSAMGLADKGMITHEAAGKMVEGFQEKLALYDGRSLVDKNPVLAKKELADPQFLKFLDPLARVELSSQADAKIRQQQAEARAALAEARANASASVADLDATIASGLPPSKAIIDQARADVRASGDARLGLHLSHSLQAIYFADGLRKSTPQEVEGTLNGLAAQANTSGADPAMAAAYQGGRKFLDGMNRGLAQDPLGWASQQGVVQIAPLAMSGADQPIAWQSRIRAADFAAQHYGVEPHYLTAAESQNLKTQLANNTDPRARMLALQNVVGGLGSRAIPELARLGVSPALVTAGGLLTAGPAHAHTAFDIVNGETALASTDKRGDGQSMLRPSEAAKAMGSGGAGHLFGGVTLPQGLPQVAQATAFLPGETARISAAADALYAARAAGRGLTGKDALGAGEEIYHRAIQEALGARFEGETQMGGLASYRGRPVIVPATVAAEAFEGLVSHLTAQDLAQASNSGAAPVDASGKPLSNDFIKQRWLVTAGDGLYALSTTDPANGAITPVHDAKGGIYRLNFAHALTILQARAAK